MTKRKKPPTDAEIFEMIEACKQDMGTVAKALRLTLAPLIRRLSQKPLRSKYRALVLRMAGGNVSVAAKRLGICRQHLHKEIQNDTVILEGWAEGHQSRADMAESQLDKNILAGKEASLIFYLKTQCKDRGYVERQELTGAEGEPLDMNVTVNFVEPLKSGKARAVRSHKKA